MLKIRLQKIGKKNSPSYRVALVEHTTSPQGKFIEILGTYNPRLKKKNFKKERIEYWFSKGAQASATVHNLLVDEKIIDREKLMAWKPKKQKGEVPPAGGIPTEIGKEPKIEQPASEPVKAEEPKIEEVKPEEPKPAEEPKPVEQPQPIEPSPSVEGERLDPSPLNKGERVDTETKKE